MKWLVQLLRDICVQWKARRARKKKRERHGGRMVLRRGCERLREFLLKIIWLNRNVPGTRIHLHSSWPPGVESCEDSWKLGQPHMALKENKWQGRILNEHQNHTREPSGSSCWLGSLWPVWRQWDWQILGARCPGCWLWRTDPVPNRFYLEEQQPKPMRDWRATWIGK